MTVEEAQAEAERRWGPRAFASIDGCGRHEVGVFNGDDPMDGMTSYGREGSFEESFAWAEVYLQECADKRFYERLTSLTPPHLKEKLEKPFKIGEPFFVDRIRLCADAFASAMREEPPRDQKQTRDLLYVFGEVLNGEMQRYYNHLESQVALITNLRSTSEPIIVEKPTAQPETGQL